LGFFGRKKEIVIQPTYDVITQCKCITCAVQTGSACAKPKIAARNDMIENPGKMMQQIMSPGMMKNMEMMKNMNPEQLRGMSREQMQRMSNEMMKNTPKEQTAGMAPKAEDMPGPYCAYGVSVCKDLDFSKICMCSGCQIFKNFNLAKAKPMTYFCKDGKPM
jgi:hypothetical protein